MNAKICDIAVLGVSKDRPSCKIEDVGGACTILDCDWPRPRLWPWPWLRVLIGLDDLWVEGKNKLACPVFSSTWIRRASFWRRTCLSWSDNLATLSCCFSSCVLFQAEGWKAFKIAVGGRKEEGGRLTSAVFAFSWRPSIVALVWNWPAPFVICFCLSVSLHFGKQELMKRRRNEKRKGSRARNRKRRKRRKHTLREVLLNSKFLLISVNLFNSTSAPSALFTRNSNSCFSLAIWLSWVLLPLATDSATWRFWRSSAMREDWSLISSFREKISEVDLISASEAWVRISRWVDISAWYQLLSIWGGECTWELWSEESSCRLRSSLSRFKSRFSFLRFSTCQSACSFSKEYESLPPCLLSPLPWADRIDSAALAHDRA